MIITLLMVGLVLTGGFAWFSEEKKAGSAKLIALLSLLFFSVCFITFVMAASTEFAQLQQLTKVTWIAVFNIHYQLALDHLSIMLLLLTFLLSIIAVLISWREITYRRGFYYFNLLLTVAGIIGVFTAVDMFLFFFFWEVMLLPMTALIAIWGHENRRFAAIKFFIFTQVSSLLMLIAIILMAYLHLQQTGSLSFSYQDWLKLELPQELASYLMLGFFIAFAVKLPSFPVHSWLPDAHTQAPTAGSVLLAGVLLKTGAYGLIRFVIVLFPQASQEFAPIAAILALISILYGAKMAFAQSDFKRLVAYSSISHMGFVMLALFSFNVNAFHGAVITLVAHGLSSAALFAFAGMLYARIHSRDLAKMGGFWQSAPVMGGFGLAFCAAAFGLPGMANFVGEFFSLIGAFQRFPVITILAALGIIGSAIYGVVLFQSSFHGAVKQQFIDLSIRERIIATSLLAFLLIIGVFPNVILQFTFNGGG
ncbi:NADH-quinone oxidoreductase subunit M [Thalassotalea sp. G2M2-11]|uniref:complex I subunit 4 family protein n=1 Tax=Thalassotalea sp. G2M2-11 TaxID=2787627 RepID=UPI0019CFC733|nr:NADH-quinone oxidoreductase subunit M [Thalassotalea sp. G2M2-11]